MFQFKQQVEPSDSWLKWQSVAEKKKLQSSSLLMSALWLQATQEFLTNLCWLMHQHPMGFPSHSVEQHATHTTSKGSLPFLIFSTWGLWTCSIFWLFSCILWIHCRAIAWHFHMIVWSRFAPWVWIMPQSVLDTANDQPCCSLLCSQLCGTLKQLLFDFPVVNDLLFTCGLWVFEFGHLVSCCQLSGCRAFSSLSHFSSFLCLFFTNFELH